MAMASGYDHWMFVSSTGGLTCGSLSFSYSWSTGDEFGFIRHSKFSNESAADVDVEILDGFRNILPCGVVSAVQDNKSTLLDAYKQAESFPAQTAAVYNLSSTLTDQALPSEALQASMVWCQGFESADVLLSEDQIKAFCGGRVVNSEASSHGKRGAFLVHADFALAAGGAKQWRLVADGASQPLRASSRVAQERGRPRLAAIAAGLNPCWS